MRRAAVEYLRDQLKLLYAQKPDTGIGFNMNRMAGETRTTQGGDRSRHNCKTVACLAGWTYGLMTPTGRPRRKPISGKKLCADCEDMDFGLYAAWALDLNIVEAKELFYPKGVSGWNVISIRSAITTLNKLLRTGRVDWSHAA